MPVTAVGAFPDPISPRLVTMRAFSQIKAVIALLDANCPVFVVLVAPEAERTRILDLLAGWSLGSGGDLDRISPNTVLVRPAGTTAVRLARSGVVSAVNEVFAGDGSGPLSRADEQRLRPLAARGDLEARRRLVDAYSELATLLAVRLRPSSQSSQWSQSSQSSLSTLSSLSEAAAVAAAQEELDWLVGRPGSDSLLADLIERLLLRLRP